MDNKIKNLHLLIKVLKLNQDKAYFKIKEKINFSEYLEAIKMKK